ncbi:hypothetical protein M405DRAFT_930900 [Rhizopogon salebrosus TDB-379]|nr:hypothetical protein M405DRAFT_930900 [Rhizopogon salebrosus TDB-379]
MANFNTTPTYPLHIADISVDSSKLGKNVLSAEVRIGNSKGPVEHRVGKTLSQTFVPPMKLSLQDSVYLHLVHKKLLGKKTDDVYFDVEHIFRTYRELRWPERQEYHTSRDKVNIVLGLSGNSSTDEERDLVHTTGNSSTDRTPDLAPTTDISSTDGTPNLVPTTDHIFRICPQFRILVIGKTGVGKSSLIEHAFGVQNALVSNLKRGEANIDTEFISPQNNRFVLHDSKGFEPGEGGNVNIVREFIKRRGKMPNLGERLHAIWLCIQTPSTGGRVLETGTEDFLELKCGGQLGNVPVIVVFTQYDKLINQVDYELGLSGDVLNNDIKGLIKSRAETKLQEICIGPLDRFVASKGSVIPHATVSTSNDYKESLVHLIQITEGHVYKHVAADASLVTSVAQRVDHGLKIKASINVGKRKYWRALASCAGVFKDRTVEDCLHVIHTDIVAVWNFNDPHRYLSSKDFRTLMVNTVDNLDAGPPAATNPRNTITVGLSMVGAITGVLTALAVHAAPIVVPIVATVLLVKWISDVYEASYDHLRRFISYIVDLTIILQTLYLVSDEDKELSIRSIKLAVAAYHGSIVSVDVHARVQEYVRKSTILDRARSGILDEVIELVNSYSIPTREIYFLRQKIPAVGSTDEPW